MLRMSNDLTTNGTLCADSRPAASTVVTVTRAPVGTVAAVVLQFVLVSGALFTWCPFT